MIYKEQQRQKVLGLLKSGEIFSGDCGGGIFGKKSYPFALLHPENNLYQPIRQDAIKYFFDNNISWWGGHKITSHPLSSQVACLNHLFPIRADKLSVLNIIQNIDPSINEILPVPTDVGQPAYISFEVVSNNDNLNEGAPRRGNNCTSIDAFILGKSVNGKRTMFLIEWKYTEFYGHENKGLGPKGVIRKTRYNELIQNSGQLKKTSLENYYFEPFYQLMRQTLWAEQIILHQDTEKIKADDFKHLHIIPKENINLLEKKYECSGFDMESTWRSCLIDQSKYLIISPKDFFAPLNLNSYKNLLDYLKKRYW